MLLGLLVMHRATAAASPMTAAVGSCRRLAFASSAAAATLQPSRRRALVDGHSHSAISTASSRRWMTILSSESASSGDGGSGGGKKTRKPKGKAKRTEEGEETFRLDRLLANRGVGTRTEVTVLIRRGKIKRADTGEVVKDPSLHLPASLVLFVNEEPVAPLPILVAYHKPLGVHSTIGDPMGRPNLEDALPPRLRKSFHPVGRLDADTTGLLLFSGDGQLTQRLLHPSSNVQRQYLATVEGEVDEAALRTRLAAGVETADGTYEADLLGFEPPATVCVGVAEGKHRMVRRMLANAGYGVLALHRVRYGEVALGELGEGEAREITPDSPEGRWAQGLLAGGRPKPPPSPRAAGGKDGDGFKPSSEGLGQKGRE